MEDRNPPQDIEAEMTTLGAVLISGDAYKVAKSILEPGDFRHKAHGTIFAAMGELHEDGSPIDLVTLKDGLRGKGQLEDVGGASYLSELLTVTPTAGHVRHHAKIVKEKSTLRKIILLGHEMLSQAHQEGEAAHEIGHRAIAAISQVTQGSNSDKVSDMAETMVATIMGLEEYAGTNQTTLGVPTGLGDYDQIVGGFYPGDLVVIAARPAVHFTPVAA